jgi:hypothetical protein
MTEFNWTLPKEVNWQNNHADDERTIERAKEIFFRKDVLQESSLAG